VRIAPATTQKVPALTAQRPMPSPYAAPLMIAFWSVLLNETYAPY
jgi:hypothetical protein